MNNGAGMIGFNPDVVKKSIQDLNDTYYEHAGLIEKISNDFLVNISKVWACVDAQKWANEFGSNCDSLSWSLKHSLNIIGDVTGKAGEQWIRVTGTTDYKLLDFQIGGEASPWKELKCDVSVVRENIDGVRGADVAILNNCWNDFKVKLTTTFDECFSKYIEITHRSGFIGGNQQESLTNAMLETKTEFMNTIEELKMKFDKSIKDTIEKYGQVAINVASTFESAAPGAQHGIDAINQ